MIVWIASYPRSGNTFLRVLLNSVFGLQTYSVYGDVQDIASDAATAEVVGHQSLPVGFDYGSARNSESLFVIKSHSHPNESDDKVIYLVRDGRESTVSYWHYLRNYIRDSFTIEDVLCGRVPFGRWGDHLEEWDPLNRPNTVVIKFEDLVADPMSCVSFISSFIGVNVVGHTLPDFDDLQRINSRFFRKGANDSWKTDMNNDQEFVFWLLNYLPMAKFYPGQKAPSKLNSAVLSCLESVTLEQKALLRAEIDAVKQKEHQLKQISALLTRKESEIRELRTRCQAAESREAQIRESKRYRLINSVLRPVDLLKLRLSNRTAN